MPAQPPGAIADAMRIAREHHHAGELAKAEQACEAVLRIDPENANALNLLGVIANQAGRGERSIELIGRALRGEPANANFLSNLGAAYYGLGRAAEALAVYDQALAIQSDHVAALSNRGNALQQLGRYEEAVASYRALLRLKPDHAAALNNLGNALRLQGRLAEAIDSYRQALVLKPDLPQARLALANALNDYGVFHKEAGRTEEAIESYRAALALRPEYAEAHYNLGVALKEQGRRTEALACFRDALAHNPDFPEARWASVVSLIPVAQGPADEQAAYTAQFEAGLAELEVWFSGARALEGYRAVGCQQPFHLAYQEENHRAPLERYGRLCARLMSDWQRHEGLGPPSGTRTGAIRLAVVSSHLYNHSVWHALLDGWTRQLDRERVELHLYYLGAVQDAQTDIARRRAASFTQGLAGLRPWTEAILAQRPDVLLYPEIGLHSLTTKLASMRLAPVQLVAWGHPHTTGLASIDHFISAQDFEPDDAAAHYSERLVQLPHLGCYYPPNRIDAIAPDLDALGIDGSLPLLISPGMPFKYAPRHDRVYVEIARQLGRCQIVFFEGQLGGQTELLRRRLRAAFEQAGLRFDDLTAWIPWQPRGVFYGLMQRADAYLDTLGFSGFNTAMQGVEAGVPIVTREGAFLRGRLASGILRRMGLADLIAGTDDDYVSRAVRLVREPAYRDGVKERIRRSRSVLFEDVAPVRALEAFLVSSASRG